MTSTLDPRRTEIAESAARGVGVTPPSVEGERADVALAPVVRRESITWSGGRGGGALLVELDAENPHDRPTPGVLARLALAPFGAFLPHRTVDAFGIPSLMPGARVHLARPVAPFLVPAISADEARHARLEPLQSPAIAWAGNVEVRIGRQPAVERHCAFLDALAPGAHNIAIACVSCERDDAVSYAPSGEGEGWVAELLQMPTSGGFGAATPIRRGEWYSAWPKAYVRIDFATPRDAAATTPFVLEVTRRSDGTTVPVEFRLGIRRA